MTSDDISKELKKLANPERAGNLQRFFKTGPGDYGEGDIFLGIKVPHLRNYAKKFSGTSCEEAAKLLKSRLHEERMFALFILINAFSRGDDEVREKIYGIYMAHTEYINNWDLVDCSAGHIVGAFLLKRDRAPIYVLARSSSLWEKRIAIISTSRFIATNDFNDTLKISEILIDDRHDLIHKAVGWMLREVGKRDKATEKVFLDRYYKVMPRTMLRYAIEKFPCMERTEYLKGRI